MKTSQSMLALVVAVMLTAVAMAAGPDAAKQGWRSRQLGRRAPLR
jgi:hypothetical protein